jgi:hypothetical protein
MRLRCALSAGAATMAALPAASGSGDALAGGKVDPADATPATATTASPPQAPVNPAVPVTVHDDLKAVLAAMLAPDICRVWAWLFAWAIVAISVARVLDFAVDPPVRHRDPRRMSHGSTVAWSTPLTDHAMLLAQLAVGSLFACKGAYWCLYTAVPAVKAQFASRSELRIAAYTAAMLAGGFIVGRWAAGSM